jgi:hypothetical protein
MMVRDDKSAVILGLRKHHGLLAAFLEAADKIDHKRMVIGEMPKLVNVKTRQASTAPQLPQVGPSVGSAFAPRRANLVALECKRRVSWLRRKGTRTCRRGDRARLAICWGALVRL